MVASDTVVGLVGAGILLIALVGVFIVESGGGPQTRELETANFDLESAGTYTSTAGTGTQVGNTCVPQPPATACQPPQVSVDLTVSMLPKIGSGSYYVGFLRGGGESANLLGQLTESGTDHKLQVDQNVDGSGFTELIVTVETSPNPSAPSSLVVFSKPVSGGNADLAGTAMTNATMGQGEVRLNQAGGGVQVTATLEEVENATGVAYRAWFVSGEGANQTYSFVGNFSFSGDNASAASLTQTVNGVQLDDQGWFWVTYESSTGTGPKPGYPILAVEL